MFRANSTAVTCETRRPVTAQHRRAPRAPPLVLATLLPSAPTALVPSWFFFGTDWQELCTDQQEWAAGAHSTSHEHPNLFQRKKARQQLARDQPARGQAHARAQRRADAAQLQDGAASHPPGSAHTCVCLHLCIQTYSEKLLRVLTAAKATNMDITRRVTKAAAEATTELLSY